MLSQHDFLRDDGVVLQAVRAHVSVKRVICGDTVVIEIDSQAATRARVVEYAVAADAHTGRTARDDDPPGIVRDDVAVTRL